MSNIQILNFSNNDNITLLWDVLLDELNVNINNTTLINNIKIIFDSNINIFVSKINPNIPLVEMNKIFLSQVITAVNKLMPNLKYEKEIKRINISEEEINIKEPYKIEDIQAFRQNNFEKQFSERKNEFENLISLQKPKELDFKDKSIESEGKIVEMESLIQETIMKRNFDIEQIQYNINTQNTYSKINTIDKKKVTWEDDTNNNNNNMTIFNKLKKKENVQYNDKNNNDKNDNDKNDNDKNDNDKSDNNSNNILINEIAKLNDKMDKLIKLVYPFYGK
jgi:hypothetical protein